MSDTAAKYGDLAPAWKSGAKVELVGMGLKAIIVGPADATLTFYNVIVEGTRGQKWVRVRGSALRQAEA